MEKKRKFYPCFLPTLYSNNSERKKPSCRHDIYVNTVVFLTNLTNHIADYNYDVYERGKCLTTALFALSKRRNRHAFVGYNTTRHVMSIPSTFTFIIIETRKLFRRNYNFFFLNIQKTKFRNTDKSQ